MSGVYIAEIVPRKRNEKTIIKIGCTDSLIPMRIYNMFHTDFDSKQYSYYIIDVVPCVHALAHKLESFILKSLSEDGFKPIVGGREFFIDSENLRSHIVRKIHSYVSAFYVAINMLDGTVHSIGTLIKAKREEKLITQQELAKLAGVRQSTISYIESGHLGHLATVQKIIKHLSLQLTLIDIDRCLDSDFLRLKISVDETIPTVK